MLAVSFPAAAFATNCYVLATGEGEECLVVDPGIGVLDTLAEVIEQFRLRPAAVLLTHGHLDHVFSVTPVCGSDSPAYIHGADQYRLADPVSLLSAELRGMFEQQFGPASSWRAPSDVVTVADHQRLSIAGLDVDVLHAPGHTEGSVMFALAGVPDGIETEQPLDRTVLAGDVLFAGSIGRTDLTGGDNAAMQRSLRDVVLPMPDTTLVLPGHGPATTMANERANNPYLQGLS